MADSKLLKGFLKESRANGFGAVHLVCEFRTVIRLNRLDGIGKLFYTMAGIRQRNRNRAP